MYKFISFCFVGLFCLASNCLLGQTTVKKTGNQWQLLVDNRPFEVKGITFGYVNDVVNYDRHFKDLQFLGVNTIRTWATGKNTQALLDAANRYNIKVMMGIWMRHGRPGMEDDDSFDYLTDKAGMKAMYDNAIRVVKTFKDHPAVLTWGIGNEVYLNMATDPEKLAYSKLLESICATVKKLDPNHPITSVEAWTFGMDWWQKHVPSLDIYGLNSYGAGVQFLQDEMTKRNIDKPYLITEFGPTGEWDITADKNGVKHAPKDARKYDEIVTGVQEWIGTKPYNLGVFVFHYHNGNQFAAPWLLTHYKGYKRPQYWAVRDAYTQSNSKDELVLIRTFGIAEGTFASGSWFPVTLEVPQKPNQTLTVSFSYNQRKGSRKRRDQILAMEWKGNLKDGFQLKAPKEHGALKIYAEVKDNNGNMGIATSSVTITDSDAQKRKFLVPKASLPFHVYKDAENMPYSASAYMGNYKDMEVDVAHTKNVHSGKTAIELKYNATSNWYGLGLVDPANDWGDILGGYDISGAKKFSFWAKAGFSGVKATVGFGMIGPDKKYPDSTKKTKEIVLTDQWKKYTFKIKKEDLSCIRSGFVFFAGTDGFDHTIYLDDIVFE